MLGGNVNERIEAKQLLGGNVNKRIEAKQLFGATDNKGDEAKYLAGPVSLNVSRFYFLKTKVTFELALFSKRSTLKLNC